jgi:hypothetical protein
MKIISILIFLCLSFNCVYNQINLIPSTCGNLVLNQMPSTYTQCTDSVMASSFQKCCYVQATSRVGNGNTFTTCLAMNGINSNDMDYAKAQILALGYTPSIICNPQYIPNTCGLVGMNQPNSATDCNNAKIENTYCCYINGLRPDGTRSKACLRSLDTEEEKTDFPTLRSQISTYSISNVAINCEGGYLTTMTLSFVFFCLILFF